MTSVSCSSRNVPSRSTRRTSRLLCAVAALVVLGSGCRSLPVTHYYGLDVAPPAEAVNATSSAPGELRIGVALPRVEPPYDQERIAYRPPDSVQEIAFYHYHRWSAAPARLVQNALALALDRQPGVAAEAERGGLSYDVVLRPQVLRLEEVDAPSGIVASLELRWSAAGPDDRARSGEQRIVEAVASPDVEAVVAAIANGVERAAAEIARELVGADDRSP